MNVEKLLNIDKKDEHITLLVRLPQSGKTGIMLEDVNLFINLQSNKDVNTCEHGCELNYVSKTIWKIKLGFVVTLTFSKLIFHICIIYDYYGMLKILSRKIIVHAHTSGSQ